MLWLPDTLATGDANGYNKDRVRLSRAVGERSARELRYRRFGRDIGRGEAGEMVPRGVCSDSSISAARKRRLDVVVGGEGDAKKEGIPSSRGNNHRG